MYMTNGGHPFGDRFEREVNIMENVKSLDGLATFGEEVTEASDLIVQRCQNGVVFFFFLFFGLPGSTFCRMTRLLHPFF